MIVLPSYFLELHQLIVQWHLGLKMDNKIFNECIQFQLFFKTTFVLINLFISSFTVILVIFLMKSSDFLINKLLPAVIEIAGIIVVQYK